MAQRQVHHFGWVRDLPDPRDKVFSTPLGVLQTLPDKIALPDFPVYDQGEIGSCTANALAGAVQFDRFKNHNSPDFVPSRLFIYYNERSMEGSGKVAVDSGAQLRDGIKALQQQGVCPETDWPYDATPAPYDGGPFPPGSRAATQPSAAACTDAAKYKITVYQRLNQNLTQLQGCLAAGYPFAFGFSVFASWYNANPRPVTIPFPANGDDVVGGHAVLCVGYDNSTGLFRIRNSWGSGAGDNGYFYMHYSFVTEPTMASDFWVINAVAD